MRDIEEGEAIKCGDWMPAVNERKELVVQLLSWVRLMWRGNIGGRKGEGGVSFRMLLLRYLLDGEVTPLEFIGAM